MAPNASDPQDLKLVLNPARRKALLALVGGIVSHMRSKLELSFEASDTEKIAPLLHDPEKTRTSPQIDPEEQERQRQADARYERSLSNPKMMALKRDALSYFDQWARDVRNVMRKTCEGPEDPRSEQRRQEFNAARVAPPIYDFGRAEVDEQLEAMEISKLQTLYPPVQTRLTTILRNDRICVISCMVLSLLSSGHYSAHSRVLLCYLTSSLTLPLTVLTSEETEIAQTLMLASKALSADEETLKRQAENATSRKWKVGLASIAGAVAIGVTGGIAAPIVAGAIGGIMSGVGLGGVASFLGIFAMNGALVGTLFGAFGGQMTGEMMDRYAKEVTDFKFLPVVDGNDARKETEAEGRRLRVTIGINGWLKTPDDVLKPWKVLGRESEAFALRYEMDALVDLGNSLEGMVSSYAWSFVKLEILKKTVLATLWSALWPVYLLKSATLIDNPFSLARNRSEKAGEVLADALINKAQGERPVTLIGYSLGARVIYSCLRSLAERKAFGLIEDVILIGSPVPSSKANWRIMRSVVSGKLTNVYSENDYILAFMYRTTSIQFGVAGLQKIEGVEGVDNVDLSAEVSGHLRYPDLVGKILKRCGVQDVTVEDGYIEKDVVETQESLIDFGSDGPQMDSQPKGLSKSGIMDLMDMDEPMGAKSIPTGTQSTGDPLSHNLQEVKAFSAKRSNTSSSKHRSQHQEPPQSTRDISRGNSVSSTPQTAKYSATTNPNTFPSMTNTQSQKPQPTNSLAKGMENMKIQPEKQQKPRIDDSDSDEGGIQMIDNDSDGGLEMLSGDPIPDDEPYYAPKTRHAFPSQRF